MLRGARVEVMLSGVALLGIVNSEVPKSQTPSGNGESNLNSASLRRKRRGRQRDLQTYKPGCIHSHANGVVSNREMWSDVVLAEAYRHARFNPQTTARINHAQARRTHAHHQKTEAARGCLDSLQRRDACWRRLQSCFQHGS